MNLPNKLTVLRVILIPFFMLFILLPTFTGAGRMACDIAAAVLFAVASITDMLDGKIARKYNLVTDFGKFLDPIADKLMVFGAFLCFLVSDHLSMYRLPFVIIVFVVLLREFAVTSLRMLVQNNGGKVIAAAMPGKIKTVTQIVFILLALLEPHLFCKIPFFVSYLPLTAACCLVMLVFTIYSGIEYFVSGARYINPNK